MSNHFIWRLEAEKEGIAVNQLSQAFADDPQFAYALPDRSERMRYLPRLMSVSVRLCLRHGTLWAAGTMTGQIGGVALSFPMPEARFSDEELSELGFDPTDPVNEAILNRLSEVEGPANECLEAVFTEPHYYLMQLGVEVSQRRRGLGSALIKAVVDEASASGRRMSLITSVASNVPFYESCGLFEVARGVAAAGVPWWAFGADVVPPNLFRA